MVASGMLRAVIEPPLSAGAGVPCLVFLDNDNDGRSEHELARQIADAAGRISHLAAEYRATKERLGTSKDLIRLAIKEQKRDKDNKDAGLDLNNIMADDDEDIMS
ncbi:hypothetical protein MAPG_12017 [Magnaporthiopsis poae ATCC 64411]|uniref:Uncharacterized protein n=1 Tax=Magnaporthiopsis poae (strain ATCC 64411 / 73-15) TaxID=644358 RepID=A0A0C4EGN9_MAGP6|nr:hypothetical protein MAPG_12017 [Magnaporthiopsis poae ATCC 64411]